MSLLRLRSASTLADAYTWIEPVPRLPIFIVGSVAVILFSGIFLVSRESALGEPWPKVAVVALLLVAPFGAISGRRMRVIRGAYNAQKPIDPKLFDRIHDPFLTISLGLRVAMFFGIFLLVSAKPGLWGSISVVATAIVLGLLGALLARLKSHVPYWETHKP